MRLSPKFITRSSGPQHGTLSGSGATRTYTPDPDYFGDDSFTYKANDGSLDSNEATVNITVNAVNDAPVAKDDTAMTDEDTSALIDVLSNDEDVDDGDTLSVSSFTQPSHGQVSLDSGKLRYEPTLKRLV
jgi:large repetitive protein